MARSTAHLLAGSLLLAAQVWALELPETNADKSGDKSAKPATSSPSPNDNVDNIAREIRKHDQWRILDWKPKLLEKKTVYQFKLLDRKRGRVQVIEVDPAHPELESLGNK